MKATIPKPKPELKKPLNVYDDPRWRAHYNAILGALISKADIDWLDSSYPDDYDHCLKQLAGVAYCGACIAQRRALASPTQELDEMVRFNSILNGEAGE